MGLAVSALRMAHSWQPSHSRCSQSSSFRTAASQLSLARVLLSIPPPDSPGNPSAYRFPGTVCRNQDMNPGVLAKCHLTTPCSMAVRLFPSCPAPEVAHHLCCVGC
ncbi:adropin [Platysternon megacephalum]|uniref:Adropin n=1 Tax=Platysternon megacephalum TaxID=55544 RepID=A0A4D9DHN4_9SAUR|nr:adropin [Platysternon megacephalum]